MSRSNQLVTAARALQGALDQLAPRSMIIGGIAVIAQGVPRTTADVDATLELPSTDAAEALILAFQEHGIEARIGDAAAFARRSQVFLMRHRETGIPLDLSMAWLPFEQQAIDCRQTVDFAGITLQVARAEDLVIYKMVAARPRDLEDAKALLALHRDAIDVTRVGRVLAEFDQALEDGDRVAKLDALLARMGIKRRG
jgi:hypothetical protein